MKQGTIAAQIREKIDLIAALVQSTKPSGHSYSYREVLRLAGLPDDHRHVRELSNQLIARRYRRHRAKVSKPAEDVPQPGDVLLEPAEMPQGGWHYSQTEMDIARNLIQDAYSHILKAADLLIQVGTVLRFREVATAAGENLPTAGSDD